MFSFYALNKERTIYQGHIRAMRILLQQNPPISQTVDYSREACLILDSYDIVIDVSPHVPELLGIPESILLGKPLRNHLQIPNIKFPLHNTSKGELTWIKPNGQSICLDYCFRTLLDHGSRSGLLLHLTDISEEKRRYETYLQAAKFSVVGQVAAGLAHELRNPLTTIKGFMQLISSDQFPASFRPYHQLILEEIQTTDELLKNFLLLTNPTAPHLNTLLPQNLINSAVQILQPTCLMKEVALNVHVNASIRSILGDEEQLLQALLSVLQNAIEASPQKGHVRITLEEHQDNLQIKIIDQGDGIPSEVLPHIFDPFFTTRKEGIGLGLTIAQRILLNHHGDLIILDSEHDQGTIVLMQIPVIQEALLATP